MAKIKILDELLASKIAAGEVIERPASAVKELMENSLDAGATSVSVYLAEGGKRLIRVVDNGEGMARKDAPLAFLRHATSKITKEEDLDAIRTMGFRGEALASVSTVARVRLRTRRPNELTGTSVAIEGGCHPVIADDGCPEGTSIEVRDLFYNTPARQKFMKSTASEFGRAADVFKRIALINPGVHFRLVHGSSKPMDTAGGTLRARISDIFGADAAAGLIELKAPNVTGFIGDAGGCGSRKSLYIYVNGRPVQDKGINRAIIDGYGTVVDGQRLPFVVLDVSVAPQDVDINIHPAKSEVRFKNPGLIYDTVRTAIRLALAGGLAPGRGASLPGRKDTASGLTFYRTPDGPTPAFLQESTTLIPAPSPSEETRLWFHGDEREVKNPEFLDLITVGQLWGEFLIAESRLNGGEFYLIDAHGAAERAAFEGLKERYFNGGEIKRQMLLLPERVETTPDERDGITGALEYLARLGFEIIPFGPSAKAGGETFMIKATPDILGPRSSAALIKELAEDLSDVGGSVAVEERIEAALMRIACHSVIRGARMLTAEEGNALLRKLAGIDFALRCPHGRPVVKRFSRREVEAMFGR